jgi:hypothetical protein
MLLATTIWLIILAGLCAFISTTGGGQGVFLALLAIAAAVFIIILVGRRYRHPGNPTG